VNEKHQGSEQHQGGRERFQLERLVLFSDAVFAIAITLLIIEIKVPVLRGVDATDRALLRALFELLPKFIGFLLSFALIGTWWSIHHRMFGHVVRHTPRLIVLNLLFLFSIVLMPFSTGVFGEYSTPSTIHLRLPLILYVLNICFTGGVNLWLWHYIGNPANGVEDGDRPGVEIRLAKARALIVSTGFALAIPVSFLNVYAARYMPLLIPLGIRVVSRMIQRRAQRAERRTT
jgi:uncharacterized membrane protein